jgi:hypothetical protein
VLAQGERDDAGADTNLHYWRGRVQEWGQVCSCTSSALVAPAGRVIAVSDWFEGQGRMALAHGSMMACMWPAGRGRPPQAAARRAGLEFVEKLLTTKLESADMTERNGTLACFALRPVPS